MIARLLNFIQQIFPCYSAFFRAQINYTKNIFIVFYSEEVRRSHFDVSLITRSCSLNRKLFLVFFCFKDFVARWNHLQLNRANKMRTNYSCQIDIVKQFIISPMSPHGCCPTSKRRSYETWLNWWINNIFLSFCVFFGLFLFWLPQPLIKSFLSVAVDGLRIRLQVGERLNLPASLSLTAKAAAGCSGNAWWSAKGL